MLKVKNLYYMTKNIIFVVEQLLLIIFFLLFPAFTKRKIGTIPCFLLEHKFPPPLIFFKIREGWFSFFSLILAPAGHPAWGSYHAGPILTPFLALWLF